MGYPREAGWQDWSETGKGTHMQLKRLEMVGFKSFAEKTTFEFEAGVTALVGPNGCGKSNVVDAIKWILGEQSVKSLRGSQMADVIFNGGAGVKPVGAAEATLTMDNADGQLSVETEEVSVTRRVYPTGQSEYFINKKPCRLKDIRTMFLDTGVGMECYSVIEQGRIDRILQASAAQRREVFEEAAGVSKYKVRRREATAKLERTQANLLRVTDIIEEVAKQLRSVKYQAAKARRYKNYSEELRRLRVSYSLNDYHRLDAQMSTWKTQEEEVGRQQMALETRATQLDVQRGELEESLASLENELEGMQRQLGQLQAQVAAGEDGVQFELGRIQEQVELRGRFEGRLGETAGRLEEVSAELVQRSTELEEAGRGYTAKQEALRETEGRLLEMARREEAVVHSTENYKGELIGLMQEGARLSNQLSALTSDLRNVDGRVERLNVRLQGAQVEQAGNDQQGRTISDAIAVLDERLSRLSLERTETLAQRDRLQSEVEGVVENLGRIRDEIGSKRSRLEALRDLDARHEGVQDGVRTVLEAARAGNEELSGVLGMLGESIQVQEGYAHAVEAALEHRVQTLIVRRDDDSRQGLRCIEEAGGRASFVALASLRENGHDHDGTFDRLPGVLGRLRNFVSATGYTEEVLDCLLDGFYLVQGIDEGLNLRRQGSNGHRLVTLEGTVIEPSGVVTGGRGSAGGGLLTRVEERRRLEGELEELDQRIQQTQEDLSRRRARLTEAESALTQLEGLRENAEDELAGKRHALDRIRENQDRLEEESRVIGSELEELIAEHDRLSTSGDELRGALAGVDGRRSEIETRLDDLTREQTGLGGDRRAVEAEVTQIKVELARSQQMLEGLRTAIEDLKQERGRLEAETARLQRDIELTHTKENEAREAVERRRQNVERLRLEERQLHEQVNQLNARRQGLRNGVLTVDESARKVKADRAELEGRAGEVRLGLQECTFKMDSCVSRVREEYELDLLQLYQDYQPEDVDWSEIETRIEELRTKLHNVGPVNLDAIHDEESLQERLDFLSSQRDDLTRATRQLEEIIRKINRTCREKFQESFATIRSHFQEMFRKLFGGGKADVFLEDDKDILESGIEIIARPPGKEPRSLSLLSGGEKVLTAVALLFAIFKTRPSPFCVLDEVDAALDEANIGRFCSVVKDFLDKSQFIIITHSKRTMAMADVLYGITMLGSGISKKVMVRFEEYEQQVA